MDDFAKNHDFARASDKISHDKPKSSVRFPPESWAADRQARFRIPPLIKAFHSSVPALAFLNWRIEDVGRGTAVTRLPLNVESSNQYITQQAALMLLAADYTGGIALSTLFPDAPVIGFHPQKDSFGAYLWGAAATIKGLRPSADDLVLETRIPERDWDEIAAAFDAGEEVNYKARIKMFSGGRLCAVSDFQYWARNSRSLAETGRALASTHHMLAHKLKTSARLIAGLRAELTWAGKLMDPFAYTVAGPQGRAMARKFSRQTPQLADLVLARTLDCDAALRAFDKVHGRYNVINIGAGYDARPWRLPNLGQARFVHLDLPVMADASDKLLPSLGSPYDLVRIPFDIHTSNLHDALQVAGVDLSVPNFVIWEGGSMYFTESEASALFGQIRDVIGKDGRLWFDQVAAAAVADCTGLPEVEAFMESMRIIGEPFVRGLRRPGI
jgi:O-methyltransferase involved in polyketide biosynthesis